MKTIEEFKKDASHFILDKYSLTVDYSPAIEEAVKTGIKYAQRWTPVSGQIPLIGAKYLVKTISNDILLLPFNVRFNCWDDKDGDDYFCDAIGGKVTHWRPIEIE